MLMMQLSSRFPMTSSDAETDSKLIIIIIIIDFDGLTNCLANESEKFGLKLNFSKTKIMTVTRKFGPLQEAVLNNNNIEVIEDFVYR